MSFAFLSIVTVSVDYGLIQVAFQLLIGEAFTPTSAALETLVVLALQTALIITSTRVTTRINNVAVATEIIGTAGLTVLLLIVAAVRSMGHWSNLTSTGPVHAAGYYAWLGPFMLATLLGAAITLVLRTHVGALATLFTASTIMPALLYAGTVLLYVLGSLLIGAGGEVLGRAEVPVAVRSVGRDGVEADPAELLGSVLAAGAAAVAAAGAGPDAVALANQGETVLAWDRASGTPLSPAIVWQDRRAAAVCERLADRAAELTAITGLPLDPYFAAPKMTWLRENLTGDGVVTTTDSWLLHRRKSSFSDANGGSCVETASGNGVILVRDTTNRDGGTLPFTADAWRGFMADVKRS
jgi:hypothetical protein